MNQFVIQFKKGERVRYFSPTQGDPYYNAIDAASLEGAKTWKTQRGAQNYLENKLLVGPPGEKLRAKWESIEVVKVDKEMLTTPLRQFQRTSPERETSQQRGNEADPELVQNSQAKSNTQWPVFSFQPNPEVVEWLERERKIEGGEPESNTELLNRKLEELMRLEQH